MLQKKQEERSTNYRKVSYESSLASDGLELRWCCKVACYHYLVELQIVPNNFPLYDSNLKRVINLHASIHGAIKKETEVDENIDVWTKLKDDGIVDLTDKNVLVLQSIRNIPRAQITNKEFDKETKKNGNVSFVNRRSL